MKLLNKIFYILPVLFLCGCANSNGNTPPQKTEYEVYSDLSLVETDTFSIKLVSNVGIGEYAPGYRIGFDININNLTSEDLKVNVKKQVLFQESNEQSFDLELKNTEFTIQKNWSQQLSFSQDIPSITDKYRFEMEVDNIVYKLHLYETPDSLRKPVTVSYRFDSKLVHQEALLERRTLKNSYVYDLDDHLNHVPTWKDENNKLYYEGVAIDKDTTVYGESKPNIEATTTSLDVYSMINKLNRVHQDGTVVVQETYLEKEITIGNDIFYRNPNIKKIYLPNTIHKIFNNNFVSCSNLSTIYYSGTEEQWNAIDKWTTVPTSINIVFNTSYPNS